MPPLIPEEAAAFDYIVSRVSYYHGLLKEANVPDELAKELISGWQELALSMRDPSRWYCDTE